MSEKNIVELPFLRWLSGDPADPADTGLGWTYRAAEDMAAFDRHESDPLIEALLLPALRRINPAIGNDEQARRVIAEFRKLLALPDPLEANRRTLDALRDGLPLVLNAGEDARTIRLIALSPEQHHLNDFTVTNQYAIKGNKTVKADTVLLVNGIPLVVAEYKSVQASKHDWTEGVKQVHRYMRSAPALLTSNVFCVAADEQLFRFGTVAFNAASEREVNKQREFWQPWLSQYPAQRLACCSRALCWIF